jgi:glycine dehydrogenase subunit 2
LPTPVLVRRESDMNMPSPESWENVGDDQPTPLFRAPAPEAVSAEDPRRQRVTLCWDYNRPKSVGRVRAFYGNTGMFIRALAYILANGPDGLRQTTEDAVLNANYIRAKLQDLYELPYKTPSMHEVVFSDKRQAALGVKTGDIAKRLIDYGFHPYTVSFPLIVHGALMIEPTESESLEELDLFIAAMRSIAKEVEQNPEVVRSAPHSTRVSRLDEVQAARKPILRWRS